MIGFSWSGWQDSNLRPPRPKRGAITGLRYTPNGYPKILKKIAERMGLEPMRHLRVDRLAICSVTTPAPLLCILNELSHKMRMQMYFILFENATILLNFLKLRLPEIHVYFYCRIAGENQ